MTSSIIYGTNLSIPYQKAKTFTSMQDNRSQFVVDDFSRSHKHHNLSNNSNLKNQQDYKLKLWQNKAQKIIKKYLTLTQEEVTKTNNCYLIKIDEVSQIIYRRHHQKHKHSKQSNDNYEHEFGKVYIEILGNLIIKRTGTGDQNNIHNIFSKRTLSLGVIQLEQVSNTYQLRDQILMYFHSKSMADYQPIIQLSFTVYESVVSENHVETMLSTTYLGTCEINPTSGVKSKQKGLIKSIDEIKGSKAQVLYSVIMSDQFKPLQRLIPPNCLCSAEQTIAGLAGRKLPSRLNSLSSQIQFTQLYSLKLDLSGIYIPNHLIKQRCREAEQGINICFAVPLMNIGSSKMKDSKQTTMSTTIKQIQLMVLFHNGWTVVNSTTIKLIQKMEIQKKNMKKSKQTSKQEQNISIRHYTSDQVASLPFVFIDEEAILILEAIAKIQVKVKKQSQKQETHSLNLPICHSFYFPDKIIADQKQIKKLYSGSYLNKINTKIAEESLPHSKVQFYCHLTQVNKNQQTNHSIRQNTNISIVANRSQIQLEKIMLEKQRMLRENNKLKQYNRAKKIELNQEVPILDTTTFKQELYRDEIQKLKNQRKDLEDILNFLKEKVSNIQQQSSPHDKVEDSRELQQEKTQVYPKKNMKNFHNSIFYEFALNNKATNLPVPGNIYDDTLKLASLSTNLIHKQDVPLEIIKTQMTQQNYAYGFFFNWLNLNPISNYECLPRRFIFSFSFYKHKNLETMQCQVNPNTGEIQICSLDQIQPVNEQKQKNEETLKRNDRQKQKQKLIQENRAKKIIYLEVGPDSYIQNDPENFLQFISYLYGSSMQIKIIDSYSKLQFGEAFLQLKDLIRMRRNQVNIKKQLFVKRGQQLKAKLNIEVRCLKKQPKPSQIPLIDKQAKSLPPSSRSAQSRQLERIANYKKSKNLMGNQMALNRIDKIMNQQYTKQEIYMHVTRMKAQIVKVDVINRKNYAERYLIGINDSEKQYLNQQELIAVNSLFYDNLKNTKWWRGIMSAFPAQTSNLIIVDQRGTFELLPGQRATILLYFYSQRKFYGEYQQSNHPNTSYEELMKIYFHKRCIDVTLSNIQTSQLHSIYKVHILPEPDYLTYSYSNCSRRNDSKVFVQLSLPDISSNQDYVIFVDDPTVIVHYDEKKKKAYLEGYAGKINQANNMQISILNALPENNLLLNFNVTIWGAQEIYLEGKIWEPIDFLMDFHNSYAMTHGYDYILVFSEDQKIVSIRQKNPIKLNKKQSKTILRANVVPKQFGNRYYTILVKPPLISKQSPTNQVLYRYCLKLYTAFPEVKQQITLRIKITDKILQQPFSFTNDLAKKVKLKILSTHPYILWSIQEYIEVDPRSEKKVKIKINAELVSDTTKIVLSFMSDKNSFHYLFVLELDNLF